MNGFVKFGKDGTILECSSSRCKAVTDKGYYKTIGTNEFLYLNNAGTYGSVNAASGCTAGQVDSGDSYKFCLDGTGSGTQKLTWNEGKNYIFKDVDQVFGNDANKKYIVTNGSNKIIIKTGFDGKILTKIFFKKKIVK